MPTTSSPTRRRRRQKAVILRGPDVLEITMGFDGDEFYVAVGNTRIAKRSDKAWISLVPGWRVETSDDYEQIKVWYEPTTPVSGRAN